MFCVFYNNAYYQHLRLAFLARRLLVPCVCRTVTVTSAAATTMTTSDTTGMSNCCASHFTSEEIATFASRLTGRDSSCMGFIARFFSFGRNGFGRCRVFARRLNNEAFPVLQPQGHHALLLNCQGVAAVQCPGCSWADSFGTSVVSHDCFCLTGWVWKFHIPCPSNV